MRYVLALAVLPVFLLGSEQATFFNASPDNTLMCRAGFSTYKVISQKNATLLTVNKGVFFKLKNENLYIPENFCSPIDDKTEPIIF